MGLPVATTRITISRPGVGDAMDAPALEEITNGIPAVIGSPSGTETVTNGSSEQVTARLDCDVCDLRHGDQVTDESTGERWQVSWVRRRIGLGLDHMVGEILAVTDRAAI